MCTLILIWKRCVGMAASGSYEKAEKSDKVLILYIAMRWEWLLLVTIYSSECATLDTLHVTE